MLEACTRRELVDIEPLKVRLGADPISPAKEARGRRLLIASTAGILIAVYNVKVKSTAWLELDTGPAEAPILSGTLAVVVLYSFVAFLLAAARDVSRWYATTQTVYFHQAQHDLRETHRHIESLRISLATSSHDSTTTTAVEDAVKRLDSFESQIRLAVTANLRNSATQWAQLILFDVGLPLMLGAYAFVKIYPALFPFLRALIE